MITENTDEVTYAFNFCQRRFEFHNIHEFNSFANSISSLIFNNYLYTVKINQPQ